MQLEKSCLTGLPAPVLGKVSESHWYFSLCRYFFLHECMDFNQIYCMPSLCYNHTRPHWLLTCDPREGSKGHLGTLAHYVILHLCMDFAVYLSYRTVPCKCLPDRWPVGRSKSHEWLGSVCDRPLIPAQRLSGRASALWPGGCWFDPRPGHTKDFKNGTSCSFVWCSALRK